MNEGRKADGGRECYDLAGLPKAGEASRRRFPVTCGIAGCSPLNDPAQIKALALMPFNPKTTGVLRVF